MPRDYFGNLPLVAGMGFSRDILLLDDCEGTMTWSISGTGGDDVHEFAAAAAWQGAYGLRLKTRTTLAAQDDYVAAAKLYQYPASGLLVARLRVAPLTAAAIKRIGLLLLIDDGTIIHQASLNLMCSAGTTQHLNSAGTYTAIAAMAMTYLGTQWYTIELAIDCAAKTYLHARLNGIHVDLSAQALYTPGAAAARGAQTGLLVVAAAAAAAEIYADNIVTHEIPEA